MDLGSKYALEDGRYFPKSSFVHDSDNSSGIWPRRFIPSEVAVNLCARPYIATRIMSIFHWSFEYPCISIGELGALSRPSPPGCNHRTMRFQTGTGIFDSQSCKLTCDNRKVKFRIVRDDQFDSKFPQIIREIRQNLRKQLTLANSPSGRDAMHGRGLRWLGLYAIIHAMDTIPGCTPSLRLLPFKTTMSAISPDQRGAIIKHNQYVYITLASHVRTTSVGLAGGNLAHKSCKNFRQMAIAASYHPPRWR